MIYAHKELISLSLFGVDTQLLPSFAPAAVPLPHSCFQEMLLETEGIKCYLKFNFWISALSGHDEQGLLSLKSKI